MSKMHYLIIFLFSLFGCNTEDPTQFSEEALNDTFVTIEGNTILFKDILETHKGQTLLIDIWASWCGDCIKGMPKVKALQEQYSHITFIFLSLDRSQEAWINGIKKYQVEGTHYFMQSGWDGAFGEFVNLNWIPRYIIVDKQGQIKLFKAVSANDDKIKQILNEYKL